MPEPKSAMKPKAIKKRRRRWWELQEATKEYVEKMIKRFQDLPEDEQLQVLRLPRNFTCFDFNRKMPREERHHYGIILAIARPKGALEYNMLEIDRIILRRAGRVRYAR